MDVELPQTRLTAHKDWIKSVLRKYDVSWEHGFLPEKEPLVR